MLPTVCFKMELKIVRVNFEILKYVDIFCDMIAKSFKIGQRTDAKNCSKSFDPISKQLLRES